MKFLINFFQFSPKLWLFQCRLVQNVVNVVIFIHRFSLFHGYICMYFGKLIYKLTSEFTYLQYTYTQNEVNSFRPGSSG